MPLSLQTSQDSQFPLLSLERFAYIPIKKKKKGVPEGENGQLPAALRLELPHFGVPLL